MRIYVRLLLGLIGRTLRPRNDLPMENLVRRQQLAFYAHRQTKPQLHHEDRVFWSGRRTRLEAVASSLAVGAS